MILYVICLSYNGNLPEKVYETDSGIKFNVHWSYPFLLSVFMVAAAPAFAGQAVHVFACEVQDEVTEEKMEAAASAWLKAAKTMNGLAPL